MRKVGMLAFFVVFVSGCAGLPSSLPEGYDGDIATIKDSSKEIDRGKADLFYLSHIDGSRIKNSRFESLEASYGQGDMLTVVLLENEVPAEPHVFTIVGRTEYAMPLRAFMGTVYEVKGDVEFAPEPGKNYVIKGKLSEEHSSVWLEDESSGEVIETFKVEGPAKLGFFSK
ncbi:hypothetical protein [Alloalcanivorax dieselolei]|nr:hypothetical protein [Alloalcanivorax dieselolei]